MNRYSSPPVHATSEDVKGNPENLKLKNQIALDCKTETLNSEKI